MGVALFVFRDLFLPSWQGEDRGGFFRRGARMQAPGSRGYSSIDPCSTRAQTTAHAAFIGIAVARMEVHTALPHGMRLVDRFRPSEIIYIPRSWD